MLVGLLLADRSPLALLAVASAGNILGSLVNWFIGQNVMAKPTTRFVVPYLSLMGLLKEEASKIDTVYAFFQMKKTYAKKMAEQFPDDPKVVKDMSAILDRKGTLVTRVMDKLLEDPHLLSGWLSLNRNNFTLEKGKVVLHDIPDLKGSFGLPDNTWQQHSRYQEQAYQ